MLLVLVYLKFGGGGEVGRNGGVQEIREGPKGCCKIPRLSR